VRRTTPSVPWFVLIVVLASCASESPAVSRSSELLTSAPSPTQSFLSLGPSPTIAGLPVPPIPEGVYEVDVMRKDFAGVANCGDPSRVGENSGHLTLTFSDGSFRRVGSANPPTADGSFTHVRGGLVRTWLDGTYSGIGDRIVLSFDAKMVVGDPERPSKGLDTLRWSFDGTYLRFTVLSTMPDDAPRHRERCVARVQYETHPWIKTG